MANYLDLMNQMQDKRRADLTEFQPTNPYNSSAYVNQTSAEVYNQSKGESLQDTPDGYIPSEMYSDRTTTDRITSGMSNVSTANTLVDKLSPGAAKYGNQLIAKTATIPNPAHAVWVESGGIGAAPPVVQPNPNAIGAATAGKGLSAGTSGAISAIAYSIANDNNPYTYSGKEAIGMGVGDYMAATTATTMLGVAAPWLPIAATALGFLFRKRKSKQLKRQERQIQTKVDETYSKNMIIERDKRDTYQNLNRKEVGNTQYGGDIGSYNQNTIAESGMKYQYNSGGVSLENVTAEFTGNELIVNNQEVVEQGIAEGNNAKTAQPIREAMRNGRITPGPETHKNNPMPVTSDGSIYAGGGMLPFKVGNGAGVYDHASDQFKSTMSDKQISDVAKKNIKKWKSNNMYS